MTIDQKIQMLVSIADKLDLNAVVIGFDISSVQPACSVGTNTAPQLRDIFLAVQGHDAYDRLDQKDKSVVNHMRSNGKSTDAYEAELLPVSIGPLTTNN